MGSEMENVNEELIEESTATKGRKKAASDGKDKGRARRWTEPEIDQLIDLLEEKDCLWDVNKKDYHLRNKRERAFEEMRNILDIDVAEIKAKITSLRAQLGREIAKTKAKKSGQGLGENYKSSWIYFDRLQFLVPIMQAGRSKDTLSSRSSTPDSVDIVEKLDSPDDSPISQDVETPRVGKSRKRSLETESRAREELLSTCVQVLKQPLPEPEPKRQCSFSLYISEKLASFDRRTRMLAEKRISDIIFEIEMSNDQALQQNWNSDHMTQSTGRYMDMLHNSQQMYR